MRCHEAIDASILTDTAVPTSYTLTDYNERGWGWWYFPHIELRDERVVLSADYLPAGTYVYTYLAGASTAGTLKVIPPTRASSTSSMWEAEAQGVCLR